MQIFKTFTGIVAPLNLSNINTDAIIPKQFLKSIKRSGFGPNLFDNWRYFDEGNPITDNLHRKINPDFILNQPPYDKAEVLLARENFGCGSSREHAIWALVDFGFKAVLAPSFGDIFYTNSFKNGFLPVCLKKQEIDAIFKSVSLSSGFKVTINLEAQSVITESGKKYYFDIDMGLKRRLLEGLDDIGLTLALSDKIHAYEKRRAKLVPWLFQDIQ